MLDVQTPPILTKAARATSPTNKRVPLRALQMLTQSVSPRTRDYVHTYPITESGEQQKKSPLALLAATCSSIGKTEGKKESRDAVLESSRHSSKITSSLNDVRSGIKISNDEGKSSFKPYKQAEEKESSHNSATSLDKPGFRAPSKDASGDTLPHSSHSKSPEFRSKSSHVGSGFTPFQYPYLTDAANAHCFYQTSPGRMCGMYFDIPGHGTSSGHHSACLKADCPGNCASMILPTPTSLTPTTPSASSIRPLFPTPPLSAPSPVKSLGLGSSTSARSNPLYPRCNCAYCTQTAAASQDTSILKAFQHPTLPHYHRDYLQANTTCQDPYCTNCKSQQTLPPTSSSASVGSNRSCGTHCYHHHDSSPHVLPGSLPTIPPTMSHLYPYGFMLRAQNDQTGPFVCNWMQDSKNCGKNFPTSEELLQHLRTHTSAANASASLHTPCNIAGCPCNLKSTISAPTRLHSARYHPYFLPSQTALHSPSFPSALSQYASPHGIPYPSSFKPY